MVFFKASSLETPTEKAAQDEDEDIEVKTFTIGEARDMIRRGEISDMKTMVGLRSHLGSQGDRESVKGE